MRGLSAVVAVLGLGACANQSLERKAPTNPTATEARVDSQATEKHRTQLPARSHTGNLTEVAIASDGSAALTADERGGVRLWRDLDGTNEPVDVGESWRRLAIHASEDGWRIGGVDTLGRAHVVFVSREGLAHPVLTTAPEPPAIAVELTGMETIAVLSSDRSVRLYTAGQPSGSFVRRGFRADRIAAQDGDSIAAIAIDSTNEASQITVQPITQSGAAVASAVVVKLDLPVPKDSDAVHLSRDGRWLAAFARAEKRQRWSLVFADLSSGEKRQVELATSVFTPVSGSFDGRGVFWVATPDGLLSFAAGTVVTRADTTRDQTGHLQPTAIAAGGGRIIRGVADQLYVRDSTGAPRYLGYRAIGSPGPLRAISPSGERIAFVTFDALVSLDVTSGDVATLERPEQRQIAAVHFVGEDRIIALASGHSLSVYDAHSMAQLASYPVAGHTLIARGDHLLLPDRGELFAAVGGTLRRVATIAGAVDLFRSAKDGSWQVIAWSGTKNNYHSVRIDAIRSDMTASEIESYPLFELRNGIRDDFGRSYVNDATAVRRSKVDGSTEQMTLPTAANLNIVGTDNSGELLAVSGGISLSIYRFDSNTRLWSLPHSDHLAPHWTTSHAKALVSGQGGLALIDGASGAPEQVLCGYGFRASAEPPTSFATSGSAFCSL